MTDYPVFFVADVALSQRMMRIFETHQKRAEAMRAKLRASLAAALAPDQAHHAIVAPLYSGTAIPVRRLPETAAGRDLDALVAAAGIEPRRRIERSLTQHYADGGGIVLHGTSVVSWESDADLRVRLLAS